MLGLLPPRTESFLSPEHSTAPTPFMSAPSSPDWKLDWPDSKSQELFVFQTEWKGFMSSSQELKVGKRSEHHATNSSSLTGSDFEFDAGVSDVADPPVSPKLSYSDPPLSPTFLYSDFWTDELVYTKQVPVLSPIPRRSAPSQSMRQLLAAELNDDASSCASYPQSPRSQRGDEQIDRRSAGHIFGDAGETKSSGATNEQKNKSHPDLRIFQHSPRTGRVHHTDEDQYPSARRSDPSRSISHSSSEGDEPTTFKHDKADSTQQRKRWALKDLLHISKRSSHNESKTQQQVQTLALRPSKSTPTSPQGARPRSPLRSPRPMSPHEAHYKNQKAQWDEMKKKTTLPYRQGLLGCLGGASFSEMAVL